MRNKFKILWIIALVAIIGFGFTACSSDDGGGDSYSNSFTFGGESIDIGYAVFWFSEGEGYHFDLYTSDACDTSANFIWIDIPIEQMGKTIDLSKDVNPYNWCWVIDFTDGDGNHWGDYYPESGNITGTMRVSRKGSTNKFTIKVDATIDGESFKISYSGKFIED